MPRTKETDTEKRRKEAWIIISSGLYRKNLQQKDLARPLGVSPQQISAIKKNPFTMNLEKVQKLAVLLDLTSEEIITLTGLDYRKR